MTTSPPSTEVPWTAYVDSLLAWRRFVAIGLLGSWLLILLVGLLLPRQYECEATLSFPPLFPRKKDEPARAGIPIPLYKRFNKALSDEGVLTRGLGRALDATEVRSFRQSLDANVTPVTTSPLGDSARMTRDDAVIGVRIVYTGEPPEKAMNVVTALAKLCRDMLVRVYALQLIEERTGEINEEVKTALGESARFKLELQSMERAKRDLTELVRDFAAGDSAGTRQVVDTREGGHLYLPARVQLMGLRALIADNEHKVRVREHVVRLGATRQQFLEALSRRLDWETLTGTEATDIVGVVRKDLKAFAPPTGADESDLAILRLEGENLADTLASAAQATTLAQLPATRRKPRAYAMLAAAAAAAALVLLSALLGESWRRLHAGV